MSDHERMALIQSRLAHQLAMRHTKDELVQLNVMKEESIAPALQATLRKYQKAKMEDILNRKLSSRPSKERLLQLGVLKDEGLSPTMTQKKMDLQKAKVEDMLSRKLANRPTKEDLENKNVLKTESTDHSEREQIEKDLEKFLATKYSRRFSGQAGEAIPMVNWVDELLAEYTSDDSPRSSSEALRSEENSKEDIAAEAKSKTALKKPAPLERELSMQSMQHKKTYISNLVSKGRFVCRNCCSEFFEGVDMASPRYSYNNFFHEEDWKDLTLKMPSHHPEAKEKNLCNMCFGVCSCGLPMKSDACDNCGSLKPMSQGILWRAPENPRPKTMEDWQEMRKEQLTIYERNTDPMPVPPKDPKVIKYDPEVSYEYFERYRFRNTLTDEGIFLEECPEAPAGILFSIEGDDDQIYEVERETDGFYYLKPDSVGNLFVVGVSDEDKTAKNSTRIYLHDPAKNWFYYGDSSAGKIFCWDPSTDTVRPVG